jgi:hypothetical protein
MYAQKHICVHQYICVLFDYKLHLLTYLIIQLCTLDFLVMK